jgi:hypothetical protein
VSTFMSDGDIRRLWADSSAAHEDSYIAGYRACETRLAPAVRLAEASMAYDDAERAFMDFKTDDAHDAMGAAASELEAASSAYRASKPQPARDPLEELDELMKQDIWDMDKARALLAQAMERRKSC